MGISSGIHSHFVDAGRVKVWGRSSILLIATLMLGLLTPAHAQTIESLTADELETVLSQAGLSPQMKTDSTNNAPVAFGQVGEYEFTVRAMNCGGSPQACGELMFFANFNLGRQLTVRDFFPINQFNESQVFGRAYVLMSSGENGEVGVDYVIELNGGVTKDHVTQNVERWSDVVTAFINSMTASPAGS